MAPSRVTAFIVATILILSNSHVCHGWVTLAPTRSILDTRPAIGTALRPRPNIFLAIHDSNGDSFDSVSQLDPTIHSKNKVCRNDQPSHYLSQLPSTTLSRRSLFLTSAISLAGLLNMQSTNAAETPSDMPSKQVVTSKNKKAGGLANKLRGVGRIMVSALQSMA
jgi:hypothetical protein